MLTMATTSTGSADGTVPPSVEVTAVVPPPAEAPPQGKKRSFTFPSAYTVLFLLLILVTIATWFIPAGRYNYGADGKPIPDSYHTVAQNPQRILQDALQAPINGMYGLLGSDGSVSVWNSGVLYGA